MARLLKTSVRGGVLTLTHRELVLGEGWLGVRNVRRFPLTALTALEVLSSPHDTLLRRNKLLRFRWADGEPPPLSWTPCIEYSSDDRRGCHETTETVFRRV
jgi:hypothetical protein